MAGRTADIRAAACGGAHPRARAGGLTLVELVIALVVISVLVAIGLPNFTGFMSEQRVRAVASDLAGDLALARAEAASRGAPVIVARAGAAGCLVGGAGGTVWREGWCLFADANRNGAMDAGEQIKVQQPINPPLRICSPVGEFANTIVFGPRGQVVRTTAIGANDGIIVTDDTGGAAEARTRALFFGLGGRVAVVNQNRQALPC
ncbi:MAG: GspH/FimT family pseudopilin [Pseudomonadota bacterium]